MVVEEQLLCFLYCGIRGESHHADTGDQNIADGSFVKLEGGNDQIAFLFFQYAFLLDLVNDVFQFVLGDTGRFLFGGERTGEQTEEQYKRRH